MSLGGARPFFMVTGQLHGPQQPGASPYMQRPYGAATEGMVGRMRAMQTAASGTRERRR